MVAMNGGANQPGRSDTMTSKLLAIAALSVGLAVSPLALAQTHPATGQTQGPGPTKDGTVDPNSGDLSNNPDMTGTTSSTSSGGEDTPSYLTGPQIREFFTDNNMSTLRSTKQLRSVYGGMSVYDRARLRADCEVNQDPRYDDLCASVGAM
jgi:hypothetical protein